MSELEIQAKNPKLIWENNPALVQLLGLSPLLAVSTTLSYGIGLGFATLCVCVLSCLTTSLIKHFIVRKWRLIWFMVILATYATVVDTLAQLYFFPLYLRLGIYVPLICCNAAILVRMETAAQHSHWLRATADAFKTGLGLLIALILFSACRELISTGSLLSNWEILLPTSSPAVTLGSTDTGHFFSFVDTQAGALILLGLLLALSNVIASFGRDPAQRKQETITPAQRARVTGRLIRDDTKESSGE